MKSGKIMSAAALLLAVSMMGTCAFADEAATDETAAEEATEETAAEETESTDETAENSPLSGTYISNVDAVKAYEGVDAAIADGSLDELAMTNAIMATYYTEAYYFNTEGKMIHYTADEGSNTGYYTIEDGVIYLGTSAYSVAYPIEIGDNEIVITKGDTAITYTKILDTTPVNIIMEDFTQLEIESSDVEVTDDEIESEISDILSDSSTTETITEGTVEEGDTVNIAFSGVLEGETDPFDGGTSDSYDLTLGSGTMIDGFEEGIEGNEIGSTFDINVTFPEDYSSEDLAGKNAVFTITINSKSVTNTPELTDDFVKEYAAENLTEELNTVDELKQYIYDTLYDQKLESAILSAITAKAKILSYDSDLSSMLMEYSADGLSYYASMYGIDADTYASYCGYSSATEYEQEEAQYYLDAAMIANEVLDTLGVEYTSEEVDAAIEEYMATYGYDESYSLEDFKTASGDTWLWLYENFQLKRDRMIDELKANVVFVDTAEDAAAETEAAETEVEAETEAE